MCENNSFDLQKRFFLTDILAINFSISEFYVYLKDKQVREVKARNRKIEIKRTIIGR